MLKTIEKYHFSSELELKMKTADTIISGIISSEGIDDTVEFSTMEVYEAFLDSKINATNKLEQIVDNYEAEEIITSTEKK